MKTLFKRLVRDTCGTSAVEYGIILAMIFLAIVTAVNGMSNENDNIWTSFSNKTKEAIAEGNSGGS